MYKQKDECLKEESRFHYLTHVAEINRIRLERAEQEQKWQNGNGRLMRDFPTYKDLYSVSKNIIQPLGYIFTCSLWVLQNKLTQQEQLIKQLRKNQRDLKETSDTMGCQKGDFQVLLIFVFGIVITM
jgi:intraflagellar transport protein 81